jgi:transglutaminase-like putative cysteine protease
MRIRVEHETSYRFSSPIFLEPHLIRLKPRQDAGQMLEHFSLTVSPEPVGQCEIVDACGNAAHWLWFEGMWEELVVRTEFTARTLRDNPFDYLLHPCAFTLPLDLPALEREALTLFLRPGSPSTRSLAKKIMTETGGDSLQFLNSLNTWIYQNIAIIQRLEPGLHTTETTLQYGCGACRDVSLVFMEVCREAGIPTRFVSGYQIGDPEQTERDLHAYPEVYLPGAGWRGYDPTLGLTVVGGHLALCAASEPELTAPITGSFRGSATHELLHRIHLEIVPEKTNG